MARHGGEYFVTGGAHNHGSDKDELARIDAVRACLIGAESGRERLQVAFEEGRNA